MNRYVTEPGFCCQSTSCKKLYHHGDGDHDVTALVADSSMVINDAQQGACAMSDLINW